MPLDFRYPRYDLDESVEVARKILERGSGATVSNHELAALLDYSGINNGAFLNRVASARLFGLIEGRADAISATQRALQIVHPDYPQTADQARIEAFKAVPLYAAFLDAFRGRELPNESGMLNTLVSRYSVPSKDARGVLTRLLESAEQAGLFRVGGATRMIEPTFPPIMEAHAGVAEGTGTAHQATVTTTPTLPDPGARRFPKIIDGALDLMPAGPPWDEDEYREWLSFFDQACRVYYRIRRSTVET